MFRHISIFMVLAIASVHADKVCNFRSSDLGSIIQSVSVVTNATQIHPKNCMTREGIEVCAYQRLPFTGMAMDFQCFVNHTNKYEPELKIITPNHCYELKGNTDMWVCNSNNLIVSSVFLTIISFFW